jgi:hypothetical protein
MSSSPGSPRRAAAARAAAKAAASRPCAQCADAAASASVPPPAHRYAASQSCSSAATSPAPCRRAHQVATAAARSQHPATMLARAVQPDLPGGGTPPGQPADHRSHAPQHFPELLVEHGFPFHSCTATHRAAPSALRTRLTAALDSAAQHGGAPSGPALAAPLPDRARLLARPLQRGHHQARRLLRIRRLLRRARPARHRGQDAPQPRDGRLVGGRRIGRIGVHQQPPQLRAAGDLPLTQTRHCLVTCRVDEHNAGQKAPLALLAVQRSKQERVTAGQGRCGGRRHAAQLWRTLTLAQPDAYQAQCVQGQQVNMPAPLEPQTVTWPSCSCRQAPSSSTS